MRGDAGLGDSKLKELAVILGRRDFRLLYGTRLVSQLSDGVFQVALAGYVFFSPEKQTTPARAAAAFAVLLLPYSLVGPFAGVFIDRWSRRQILVYAPLVRAVLTTGIAALLLAHNDGPVFYLAALLVLGVNRFFLSALSAALPHVVTRDQLVLGNSLSVTSGTVAAFVGAGVGWLLHQVFGGGAYGTAAVLLWCAMAYVVSSAIARVMPRGLLGPILDGVLPETREALGNVLRGLVDGVRHTWARRPAALALAAISLHRFLYGIVLIMAGLLYRNSFTTDPEKGLNELALFLTVSGAGFLVGALVTPSVVDRTSKSAWITFLMLLGGLSTLILIPPFARLPFLLEGFILGLVSQGVKLSVDTIVQETIDDAYRGRVFSAYDMLFNATFVGAAAVAAVALPVSGRSYPVAFALAAAYLIAAAAYQPASARAAHTLA